MIFRKLYSSRTNCIHKSWTYEDLAPDRDLEIFPWHFGVLSFYFQLWIHHFVPYLLWFWSSFLWSNLWWYAKFILAVKQSVGELFLAVWLTLRSVAAGICTSGQLISIEENALWGIPSFWHKIKLLSKYLWTSRTYSFLPPPFIYKSMAVQIKKNQDSNEMFLNHQIYLKYVLKFEIWRRGVGVEYRKYPWLSWDEPP